MAISGSYEVFTITNPSSALTDFSFILDLSLLSSNYWADTDSSDGTKMRFAKGDGVTELAFDPITFDSGANTGLVRIKWTGSLSSTGTQELRCYPAKTANISYGVNDTYGQYNAYSSTTVGYWPIVSDANDRTFNQNNGDVVGSLSFGDSPIFVGGTLMSDTNYITVPPNTSLDLGNDLFISAHITMTDGMPQQEIGKATGITEYMVGSNFNRFWTKVSSNNESSNEPYVLDAGNHIFGMSVLSNNSVIPYQDGVVLTPDIQQASDGTTDPSNGLTLGRVTAGWMPPQAIGHVLIHNQAIGGDWIAYEHTQTSDNSTFWGAGTWVPAAPGGITLDLGKGTYTVTGYPAELLKSYLLNLDKGSYTVSGKDLDLVYNQKLLLQLEKGLYSVSGKDLGFEIRGKRILELEKGSYLVDGKDLRFIYSGNIPDLNFDNPRRPLWLHIINSTSS